MSWFKSKWQGIKEWYSSQDTQQSITVITSFASDAFKVIMASMLCVFVPQACTVEESNRDIFESIFGNSMPGLEKTINGTLMTTHICTFNENFSDLIDFNTFVLAFNFVTLGYFIYVYWVELRRESWMIDNLDYDKERADDAIIQVKEQYPEIIEELQAHNTRYVRTYKYLHVIYLLNFFFSAILVLYYYYYDYRTATTLVTNTILCSNKIRVGREIATQSHKKQYAYSFYNHKNISFNTIDASYLKESNTEGDELKDEQRDGCVIETNLDNRTIKRTINKNPENIQKHISNIRKYINRF
jgi:hypothetical protein